ncbi:hypothetical protein HID58_055009 [Brassica napus]|uniref:Uncharacterized protein n=1 Tax=Brassica napus TaxID=3708 RepID=A0ABQ8AJ96_BRANA|nr:hypothetical protein HID58_055009 [Brassica napus]
MVSSGRISVSGVASIFGGRPDFTFGALTFFFGVGRPIFVSVSRSSLMVTTAFYWVFPIMVLIYGSCGLLGPIDSPSYHPSVFLPSSVERRSSERLEFQRRPFWLDGFFSVKAPFHWSSFQPLQFRRRKTILHVLTHVQCSSSPCFLVLIRDSDEPQFDCCLYSIAVCLLLRHKSRRPSFVFHVVLRTTQPSRAVIVCHGGCDGRNPLRFNNGDPISDAVAASLYGPPEARREAEGTTLRFPMGLEILQKRRTL